MSAIHFCERHDVSPVSFCFRIERYAVVLVDAAAVVRVTLPRIEVMSHSRRPLPCQRVGERSAIICDFAFSTSVPIRISWPFVLSPLSRGAQCSSDGFEASSDNR